MALERLPRDGNRIAAQLTPASISLATTVDSTISTSTVVTFQATTSIIRVYAVDKDICLKWGTSAATATAFDEIIPANQVCDFFVPQQSLGVLYTAANFIERTAGATLICIEK